MGTPLPARCPAAALTQPHLQTLAEPWSPVRVCRARGRDLLPLKLCFSFHASEGKVRRVCIWATKALRTGCDSADAGSKTALLRLTQVAAWLT